MSKYRDTRKGFKRGREGPRAEFITNEHLEMLDALRESGVTNMYGAAPYINADFPELTEEQAAELLGYWMQTLGNVITYNFTPVYK